MSTRRRRAGGRPPTRGDGRPPAVVVAELRGRGCGSRCCSARRCSWLGLIYIVALAALLVTAFWSVDSFTGELNRSFTLDNIITRSPTESLYQTVTMRTVGVALPSRSSTSRSRCRSRSSWRRSRRAGCSASSSSRCSRRCGRATSSRRTPGARCSREGGILEWSAQPFGLRVARATGCRPSVITLAYLWLPYVILPIYAGLERVPDSLLEASGDLGAQGVAAPCARSCSRCSCRRSSPARSSASRCRSATTSP